VKGFTTAILFLKACREASESQFKLFFQIFLLNHDLAEAATLCQPHCGSLVERD